MAEAIGIAILSAASVEASAATAGVVGSIAVAAVSAGVSLAASALQSDKRVKQQAVFNDAIGPRRRVYGQAMVGGTRCFWDARNGELIQGIVLCEGPIDGVAEYWVGDKRVMTDGGGLGGNVQDSPMTNKIFFEGHFGSDAQQASTTLLYLYPDIWTAQHQLDGLAYVVVVFQGVAKEKQQQIYPQGTSTTLRFVVKGAKVWDLGPDQDPNNPGTWTWNDLSAPCLLDYIRHPDGMRQPLSRIDLPSFYDFNALCAQPVARRDGTLVARYRCWGSYTLDEAPKDVLARICATCDATLVQGPTGLIGVRGGRYRAPLVTIPTANIVTAELAQGSDKLDSYNRLKVTYTDPDNYYQTTELQARDDLAAQAQVGVIDQTFDMVMVPEWTQAARLAKIRFARDNPTWRGTLGTHLSALDALNQETFHVTYDPVPGIGALIDADCVATAFSIRGDASGCDIGFVAVDASAWDWNPQAEEPPRPITPQVIAAVDSVPPPSNVSVAAQMRGNSPYAVATWTASTRTDATPEAQVKASNQPDSAYVEMAIRSDAVSAEAGPLQYATAYTARVRYAAGGTVSDWVTSGATTGAAPAPTPTTPAT